MIIGLKNPWRRKKPQAETTRVWAQRLAPMGLSNASGPIFGQ